jgi:hypothetical protein
VFGKLLQERRLGKEELTWSTGRQAADRNGQDSPDLLDRRWHAKLSSHVRFEVIWRRYFRSVIIVVWELLRDGLQFMNAVASSRPAMAAEVLFLRKQLAYYQDPQIRPRRLTEAARLSLVLWSRLFNWKEALVIVTPATFVRWHRKGFRQV